MSTTDFEIVTTTTGAISIRDHLTGETMHNPVGPWIEANALYIEQSELARRLRTDLDRELVVFDVGLGAAANALAVLHCARAIKTRRPLRLISFERELALLEFALAHADQFAHFAGYESAIRTLLDKGQWSADGIQWELRHGDFNQLIVNEPTKAHLVYFDPYSPKKNTDMWNLETFERVHRACAPEGATLYTYSRSTPVRVALLLAGFHVGTGLASGLKDETTQAATQLADLAKPLDAAWLKRWEKSHTQNAAGAPDAFLETVRARIPAHPQFA